MTRVFHDRARVNHISQTGHPWLVAGQSLNNRKDAKRVVKSGWSELNAESLFREDWNICIQQCIFGGI
jgi:hypothetical protein